MHGQKPRETASPLRVFLAPSLNLFTGKISVIFVPFLKGLMFPQVRM